MNITIVRHGETNENRKKIIQGHSFGSLSDNGKEQVRRVAERLKDERFDAVFSSDLERARDSASMIMEYHESEVICTPLLRERSVGEFEGKSYQYLKDYLEKQGFDFVTFRPKKGENYQDIRNRAIEFLKQLESSGKKNVLIVTHGGFLIQFIGELLGYNITKSLSDIEHSNTGIFQVEKVGDRWEIIRRNDTSHLEGIDSTKNVIRNVGF